MQKTIQLSLVLGALLSQLHANEIQLKTFEITSTAIATDELQSTDAVEVYTQKDIEKSHAKNLYEFLNTQTSIITMPSYGNPFSQLIDIRGYGSANGNQNILITINGRKLNNIDNVPQLLSSISPSSISKIEIIKSSGIVVGGDGANAGVINITTKKNNDKEITLYAGTYGTSNGSVYIGHNDDKLSISASGEIAGTNGIRYVDSNGNKDKNSLKNGVFNLAYQVNDALELRVGASATRSDVLYANSITKAQYDSDPTHSTRQVHQLFDSTSLNSGLTYLINDEMSFNLDVNHEKKTSDYIPSFSGASHYVYDSASLSFDYISDDVSLIIGGDIFNGDRKQNTNTTTKDNIAAFAMAEFYANQSTFKIGYRLEKVSYSYITPTKDLRQEDSLKGVELGYNYTLDKEKSFFVNYSHSYQAPNIDSFFATVYGAAPTYTASTGFNDFINPMTADNYNIGFNYFTPLNKLKIAIYYIDLKDEIYYRKTSSFTGLNTNIDSSHKYGFDFYNKYLWTNTFNVAVNYNYVQAIIDKEIESDANYAGKKLPGVSNHNFKVTLNYMPTTEYTLSLTQIYRSKAYAADDFDNNFSQKQDAFKSTDISLTYTKDNYDLFAKVNNIFNQHNGIWIKDDAIYPINFTTTAIAGVKIRF